MIRSVEPDWRQVGAAVRQRREALGLAQGVGDVSAATWRKVEKGVDPPYRRATLIAIARALDWPDDAIARMLAGRPPDEPMVDRDDRSIQDRIAAIEAELMALKQTLMRRART